MSNEIKWKWDECRVLDRSEEQVKFQEGLRMGKENGKHRKHNDEINFAICIANQGLQVALGFLG